MGLVNVLKYSRRWQIGLVAALGLVVVVTLFAFRILPSQSEDNVGLSENQRSLSVRQETFTTEVPLPSQPVDNVGLSEDQQLLTVSRGTFTTEVAVSGSLVFPLRGELTFDTLGVVGDVMVREGQQVNEGDVLAKLDGLTVAALGVSRSGERRSALRTAPTGRLQTSRHAAAI